MWLETNHHPGRYHCSAPWNPPRGSVVCGCRVWANDMRHATITMEPLGFKPVDRLSGMGIFVAEVTLNPTQLTWLAGKSPIFFVKGRYIFIHGWFSSHVSFLGYMICYDWFIACFVGSEYLYAVGASQWLSFWSSSRRCFFKDLSCFLAVNGILWNFLWRLWMDCHMNSSDSVVSNRYRWAHTLALVLVA